MTPVLPVGIREKITLADPPAGRPVIGPCWIWTILAFLIIASTNLISDVLAQQMRLKVASITRAHGSRTRPECRVVR